MAAEPNPHEPAHAGAAARPPSPGGLLEQARQRFQELAATCVQRCELRPDMARAVQRSLELSFAHMVKEEGSVLRRQFGQDVEAAVRWAVERLAEASRRLAGDTPGHKPSPLQNLAILEVQALEMMLPEHAPAKPVQTVAASVPAAQLRSFCAHLNDGLDFAHKADDAADRHDLQAYQGNYVLSRNKWRNAAKTLRRMFRRADSAPSELTVELCGFQLELAAYAGSIRMFLKALCTRDAAAQSPEYRMQILDPHCLIGDLLPILFDRHFAFTIRTPRNIPPDRSQALITEAHDTMWQKVVSPVSALLADPGRLRPTEFKRAVEEELRQAINDVNQQFAPQRVVISISSNSARAIRRREW
jgi:hypothetical protein